MLRVAHFAADCYTGVPPYMTSVGGQRNLDMCIIDEWVPPKNEAWRHTGDKTTLLNWREKCTPNQK